MGQKQKSNNTIFSKVVNSVLSHMSGDQKVTLLRKYMTAEMVMVLEDKELSTSVDAFLANSLNVSETSRNTFMHRNTLLYRIDKIYRVTKLNLRNFEDAVAFKLLEIMYREVYKK